MATISAMEKMKKPQKFKVRLRALPHLLPEAGAAGRDPGRDEVQLVNFRKPEELRKK
jgi:hypothetical protein